NASGATSITLRSMYLCTRSTPIISYNASYSGRRYGSIFCARSPGRKPSFSPASTAGRTSSRRCTRDSFSASTALATARKVLPVPAGPTPKLMSWVEIACRYLAWLAPRPRTTPRLTRISISCGTKSASPPAAATREILAALRRRWILCGSKSSTSDSEYRLRSSASAARAASGSPLTRNTFARLAISTPRRDSIWRRCSSKGPARLARRSASSGSSVKSRWAAVLIGDGSSPGNPFLCLESGGLLAGVVDAPAQGIRHDFRDQDVYELADQPGMAGEINVAHVFRTAGEFAGIARAGLFHQHPLHAADHAFGDGAGVAVEQRLQAFQARVLLRRRRVVRQAGRGRARAARVDEGEALVEADVLDQLQRRREVGLGLAREADDEVGADRNAGLGFAQLADA